ncbi:ATP-dependent helicase [Corynebacterium neomassiliense]|uniref:ATP-dependent helicase n=1 Tax=Corynebacterium neomassiliense TaxID=2079482 RepID=UPI001030BF4E|nr:ATP-dependent DNA helicase [Corynebacterium neomassiliense]
MPGRPSDALPSGDGLNSDRAAAMADASLRRRIGSADSVRVRLDPGGPDGAVTSGTRVWNGLAGALVVDDDRVDRDRAYAVLGGPGTGKTSLLLDTLVNYLRGGGDPESVMVVTPSKESATDLRARLTEMLRDDPGYAATGTPVRSVHSWAFALLRSVAARRGDPLPRLMTGADHDLMVRALLRGNAEDGSGSWPERMRPALGLVGFARQLRDLLLRAEERGIGPDELSELGRRHDMDMWVAAGDFLRESRQVGRLSGSRALNASELLHRVLAEFDGSAEGRSVLEKQRSRIRLLLVDDAHNLDPASARLLDMLTVPGARTLVAGDADQCVFHFRGADEEYLTGIAADPDHRVVLSRSRRLGPSAVTAVNRLTRLLPPSGTRIPVRAAENGDGDAGQGGPVPDLTVCRAPSATAERLTVADAVRRAHVSDRVAWDRIAVVVRTVGQIPPLRRTLLSHGVPVKVDPTSVVLAEQPLVASLLLAVEALTRPLTVAELRQLVESPVGGADPVMLRRLERAVAPIVAGSGTGAMEAVALLVTGRATDSQRETWSRVLGPRERDLLDRVTGVITAGREAVDAGGSVEAVLWAVWQATGLSTRLQTRALRGGTLGSQADRDLDAVMSLFDLAGDLVERTPAVSLETFLDGVRAQELPTGTRDRRGVRPDAVEILPAHAAAGREWEVVVVSGVQEDTWPAGPTVGGLFGQQELVDLVDRGIEPGTLVSRAAPALAEERRLFLLAVSRATRRTLVTAVESTGDDASVPSRFLDEVRNHMQVATPGVGEVEDADDPCQPQPHPAEAVSGTLPRVLAMEPLVAELRDAVCDPSRDPEERRAAARNLAVLADAGVYGAAPGEWWGTAEPSSTGPAVAYRRGDAGPTLRISPTTLESLGVTRGSAVDGSTGSAGQTTSPTSTGCDLATFFDSLRRVPATQAMKVGTLIHALAEGFARGLTEQEARDFVSQVVPWIIDGPAWTAGPLVESCLDGVERLHRWLLEREGNGRTVEVEKKLEQMIGHTPEGLPVILTGRADRLETAADGATTVVDFKTGKTAKTAQQAEDSAQLASYQLLVDMEDGRRTDGAMLVYPRVETASVKTLGQGILSADDLEAFRRTALATAARIAGPGFRATDSCAGTEYACLCPACRAGEQVV